MKKLIKTLDLSYQDWLQYRKKGIGGSDAGAICGLNPYNTAMGVYQDKISDDISVIDNESIRLGHDLEDYVARRFCEATGKSVRKSNYMYGHSEYPYMIADVDRLIVGEEAGLECKTASLWQADKWKDGKIPPHYEIQCHHYMMVTGARAWYIAVLIMGKEFIYQRIDREESIIEHLQSIEEDFWINHVIPKKMPYPDGSRICDDILHEYYPRAKEGQVIQLCGFDEKLKRRQELMELLDKLEREKNQIEQELKMYIGDAEEAINDRFYVRYTNVETNRLDSKSLRAERPEIYERYSKAIGTRRLSIKAA